jgi:aminopeptidase N
LNHYLTTNKFKSGEAGQLRLSFEEITGKDLNWFWNQWYYGSGHPKLKISYKYDVPGIATVYVEQTQKSDKLFKLPIAIDIYTGSKIERKNVWLQNKIDSFSFAYSTKPSLINVDADKMLLAEKTDNKSEDNFVAQWNYAKTYQDRREALDYFAKKVMPALSKGLKDPFAGLRQYTLQKIVATPFKKDSLVLVEIERMAKSDPDNKTKAAAINYLIKNGNANYLSVYQAAINDSSYSVAGAALKGLVSLDATKGYQLAKKYSKDAKDALGNVVSDILIAEGTESDFDFIADAYRNAPPSQEKIKMTDKFGAYLLKVKDISLVKKGIDNMISFRNMIPEQYHAFIDPSFKTVFDNLTKARGSEIEAYIKSVFK